MKIIYSDSFKLRFNRQLDFIASDNPNVAIRLRDGLKERISTLKESPLKCRQSIFFENANIRDLIYKGYVVVYRIREDSIEVFGFTKYQNESVD